MYQPSGEGPRLGQIRKKREQQFAERDAATDIRIIRKRPSRTRSSDEEAGAALLRTSYDMLRQRREVNNGEEKENASPHPSRRGFISSPTANNTPYRGSVAEWMMLLSLSSSELANSKTKVSRGRKDNDESYRGYPSYSSSANPDPSRRLRDSVPSRNSITVSRSQAPTSRLSRTPRSTLVTSSDTPGPGQYDADIPFQSGPSFSLGGRTRVVMPKPQPVGPGDYDPMPMDTSRAYSLGARDRHLFWDELRHAANGPGPAAYDIGSTLTDKGAPMGRRLRSPKPAPGPGPTKYNVRSAPSSGPQWKFSRKTHSTTSPSKIHAQQPGPGEYDAHAILPTVRTTIINRPRSAPPRVQQTPGPGEYFAHDPWRVERGPQWTFHPRRARPRSAIVASAAGPGPADYNVPSCIGSKNDSRSISMGRLFNRPEDRSHLGPGEYTIPTAKRGPSFSLGARLKPNSRATKEIASLPGPGEYVVSRKLGTKRITIARRIEIKDPHAYTPGPGEFDVQSSTLGGPKWAMGIRHPIHSPESVKYPGPGAYSPKRNDGGDKRAPAFGPCQSTRRRPAEIPDAQPLGPGAYNLAEIHLGPRAPVWSISLHRPTTTFIQDTPGPGEYGSPQRLGAAIPTPRIRPPLSPFTASQPGLGPGEYFYSPPPNKSRGFTMGRRT